MKTMRLWCMPLILLMLVPVMGAAREQWQQQSFAVSSGGQLLLNVRQGDVEIRLIEGGQINLSYRGVDRADLKVEHQGNMVRIEQSSQRRGWRRDARFELEVPSQFDLDLKTGGGDVRIDGILRGTVVATTRGGDIDFGNVLGEADISTHGGDISGGEIAGKSQIKTHGGDISLGPVGGALDVSTHGGDLTLSRIGASLVAKSHGGDIEVGDVNGDADIVTHGGDIQIGNVAATAYLKTLGGDVELKSARGEITAKTHGGDLFLMDLQGSVDASTLGGDIEVQLMPEGPSSLNSKGGDVRLMLPAGAGATIEATIHIKRNRWNDDYEDYTIESDFTAESLDQTADGSEIRGLFRVNGGGPLITIETTNGKIRLERR